jgi:hypothetical protein
VVGAAALGAEDVAALLARALQALPLARPRGQDPAATTTIRTLHTPEQTEGTQGQDVASRTDKASPSQRHPSGSQPIRQPSQAEQT